jgi:hypothetical protein
MDATPIQLVMGILLVVAVLALLGAAATTFGADSRIGIGDDHGTARRPDWF